MSIFVIPVFFKKADLRRYLKCREPPYPMETPILVYGILLEVLVFVS